MDEKEKEKLLKEIEEYTNKIKKGTKKATIFYNRANSYRNLKIYDEAIKDYNKAIELNPNNASYYNNRGISFNNLKKYDEAIEDFNKAIELDPNYKLAYNNRGNFFNNSEKYDKAIEDFNKAIELDPSYHLAYNNRGISFRNLKKYDKAIEDCNKAIDLNPNSEFYYCNRGLNYTHLKKYDEAIEDCNKAINLNPNYKLACELKGIIFEILQNSPKKDKINKFSKKTEYSEEVNKTFEKIEDNEIPSYYYDKFNDILSLYLRSESDKDFEKVTKKFTSFIKEIEKLQNIPPILNDLIKEAKLSKSASSLKVKRLRGYLIFSDILGWKGIWKKFASDEEKINIVNKLLNIKDELKNEIVNQNNGCSINLISDTFIIYSKTFKIANELSKKLIELCLENNLVIRGAISYGECYNRDTVYLGPAVDEAASWHDIGEEIGIFYTPSARLSMQNKIDFKNFNLLKGDIKLKSGKLETFFINWYDEEKNKDNFYNIMKNEIITPDISLKYFNTEEKLNTKNDANPKKEEK